MVTLDKVFGRIDEDRASFEIVIETHTSERQAVASSLRRVTLLLRGIMKGHDELILLREQNNKLLRMNNSRLREDLDVLREDLDLLRVEMGSKIGEIATLLRQEIGTMRQLASTAQLGSPKPLNKRKRTQPTRAVKRVKSKTESKDEEVDMNAQAVQHEDDNAVVPKEDKQQLRLTPRQQALKQAKKKRRKRGSKQYSIFPISNKSNGCTKCRYSKNGCATCSWGKLRKQKQKPQKRAVNITPKTVKGNDRRNNEAAADTEKNRLRLVQVSPVLPFGLDAFFLFFFYF